MATATLRDLALDHYSDRQKLVIATAEVAGKMWSEVDPKRIADSWAQRIPEMAAVVSGAQLGAARPAASYTDEVLAEEEVPPAAVAEPDPRGFSGQASDARGLVGLLTNPVVVTLMSIQDGFDVISALSRGRANLDMLVSTQVADAGRLADQVGITTRMNAGGYTRLAVGNSCARCLILAGRHYDWNRGFPRHPKCDCIHVPAVAADMITAGKRTLTQDPRLAYDRMTTRERSRAGFTLDDQKAIADGADINQVVNARHRPHALFTAGGQRFTRESTTRRGVVKRRNRFTVDECYRVAGDDRDRAIDLLRDNGYVFDSTPRKAAAARPSIEVGPAVPQPGFVVRQSLADASTIPDLQAAFAAEAQRITGRRIPARFGRNADLDTAREHAEGVLLSLERYPDAKLDSLDFIDSTFAAPVRGRDQIYAQAWTDGEIQFNLRWADEAGRQDYLDALSRDAESHWSVRNSGTPGAVAIHEFGHVLDMATLGEVVAPKAKALAERLAKKAGLSTDDFIRREVSGYATSSSDELVAEAFLDAMLNGPRASELSRGILAMIDAEYAKGGRKLVRTVSTPRRAAAARSGEAREIEVEGRIFAAYRELARKAEGEVGGAKAVALADLRDALPDVPRAEMDAALKRLSLQEGVTVAPVQNLKSISPKFGADPRFMDAAVKIGGEDSHLIAIAAAAKPRRPQQATRRRQEQGVSMEEFEQGTSFDPFEGEIVNLTSDEMRAYDAFARQEARAGREPLSPGQWQASRAAKVPPPTSTKKSRTGQPDGYPKRQRVPDTKADPSTPFPAYDPPEYTAPSVIANDRTKKPGGWADPQDPRKVGPFRSPIQVDEQGRPVNPYTRTGVQGRGLLGKWGPNQAADPIVTRVNPRTGKLEIAVIRRGDTGEWAIPGGMVDDGEQLSIALRRELKEETGADLDMASAREVYRGFVDDPRNTDNAWMETTVMHRHLTPEEAAKVEFSQAAIESGEVRAIRWVEVDDEFLGKLYASHGDFVRAALKDFDVPASVARSVEERFAAALTDRSVANLPPVRVTVDASSGANTSRWKAIEAQGLSGSPSALLTAVTSRVRVSGMANQHLRFPNGRPIPDWEVRMRAGYSPEQQAKIEAAEAARRAKDVATAEREIRALDRAMDQSPLPADAILWRGTFRGDIDFPDDPVGFVWTDAGYVGTSAFQNVAADFAAQGGGPLLRILTPQGTKGIRISGGGEAEILLQRGLTFRVVGESTVERFGRPVRVLDVEIVPAGTTKAATKTVKTAPEVTPEQQLRDLLAGKGTAPAIPKSGPASTGYATATIDELREIAAKRLGHLGPIGKKATREQLLAAIRDGMDLTDANVFKREAARLALLRSERAGQVADLLAEADELIFKGVTPQVMERVLGQAARTAGPLAEAQLAAVLKAMQLRDPVKIRAALDKIATKAKVRLELRAGDITMSREGMELVTGGGVRPGVEVRVVRPGTVLQTPDGTVVLKPPVVRVVDLEEKARIRQEAIDAVRESSDVLREASELIANGATPSVIRERVGIRLARIKSPDPAIQAFVRAIKTGDVEKIRKAIPAAAKKLGIKQVDEAGELTLFNPKRHQGIAGSSIKEGADVRVVRSGYAWEYQGKPVELSRPVVEELSSAEVAKLRQTAVDTSRGLVELAETLDGGPAQRRIAIEASDLPDDVKAVLLAASKVSPAKLKATLTAQLKKRGVVVAKVPKTPVKYDPALHEVKGGPVPVGSKVKVIQPEVTMTYRGETVVVRKGVVEPESTFRSRQARPLDEIFADRSLTGDALTDAVRQGVEGKYGKLAVEIADDGVFRIGAQLRIEGTIRSGGREVGTFERWIVREPDGSLWSEHVHLALQPKMQGSGFATEFNANLYEWYRRSGFKGVRTHANIDVGGYTWAAQGFDFASAAERRLFASRAEATLQELRGIAQPHGSIPGQMVPGLTRAQFEARFPGWTRAELEEQVKLLEAVFARIRKGEAVSAYEVSQLGRRPGQGRSDWWIGKALMLRSHWHGIKLL